MKRITASILACLLIVSTISFPSHAAGWNSDSRGWWYENGGSYYANQWERIDGSWYYFTADGYMDYSEYRDGCWLDASGVCNMSYTDGKWKSNTVGWWYEDGSWYPVSQWLWIDGKCYYFGSDGYMEHNCYRDGCWLDSDGAYNPNYSNGTWNQDGNGWWFDDNGWYPVNQGLWIDGDYYWFDGNGYWDKAESERRKSSDVTRYSYEIVPLLKPFNTCYYIKTDNPDCKSFRFVDHTSKYNYTGPGGIIMEGKVEPAIYAFEDVVYEDANALRVNGGYLAFGNLTDGGSLTLQDLSNGSYTDTSVSVTVDNLMDSTDYLINTFAAGKSSYFDKMDAVAQAMEEYSIYSGTSVNTEVKADSLRSNYYISIAIHDDQSFYIFSPLEQYATDRMMVTYLYPFIYDSVGYPGKLETISERIEPSAESGPAGDHAHRSFTYNGETRFYGGQGTGGGQSINRNMIKYWFKFDSSADDACNSISLSNLKNMNNEYGKLNVPDATETSGKFTWSDVRKTVGTGSSVRVANLKGLGDEDKPDYYYAYMYDDGSQGDGDYLYPIVGYLSNAWYDGRYYNIREYFEQGIKFGEKSEIHDIDTGKASIVVKNPVIHFPKGENYSYQYQNIEDVSMYDSSTGVWDKYMYYNYDASKDAWVAEIYEQSFYFDVATRDYLPITDSTFVNECTLTRQEVKAMNIDKNTNAVPSHYVNYDGTETPGKAH